MSYFRLKVMGILNPLNIFLRQEIDRMQKVIGLVRTTLRDLILAIEGTIIMNDVSSPLNLLRGSWTNITVRCVRFKYPPK